MILKVNIKTHVAKGFDVEHHFEQVVDTLEEASEFGRQCAEFMQAFTIGFGDADLD